MWLQLSLLPVGNYPSVVGQADVIMWGWFSAAAESGTPDDTPARAGRKCQSSFHHKLESDLHQQCAASANSLSTSFVQLLVSLAIIHSRKSFSTFWTLIGSFTAMTVFVVLAMKLSGKRLATERTSMIGLRTFGGRRVERFGEIAHLGMERPRVVF
jgi:hypothetical protein